METLFLGSMLMIIIIANLAWEPVSQDLYPWLHSNSVILPRDIAQNQFSPANLVGSYFRMYTLGKGLVELLEP